MLKSFEISGREFFGDGKPFKLLSGSMHYFRIVPEYWRRRMEMLKLLGCNTMMTYMAWHYHEPRRGEYDFSGMLDVGGYVRLAGELGLNVIIRPGPFICSECDLGGLPWWLLAEDGIRLRSMDPKFIGPMDAYLKKVCDIIRPLLVTNGGPIIMVQLENEYGGRACDDEYLCHIRDFYIGQGIDVPLFVSDYPSAQTLSWSGTGDSLLTANFRTEYEQLDNLKKIQPDKPAMVTEYWNGRQHGWSDSFAPVPLEPVITALHHLLDEAQGVNLYMYHGGTNFGFMNGAISRPKYNPRTTSYDVDAPLNEYGDITPKYLAEQKEFCRAAGIPVPETISSAAPRKAYGRVDFTSCIPLLDNLDLYGEPVHSHSCLPLEKLGYGYGYVAYSRRLPRIYSEIPLTFPRIRDIADIYIGGILRDTLRRGEEEEKSVLLTPGDSGKTVIIIVENSGRLNSAPLHLLSNETKGLPDGVEFSRTRAFHNWDNYRLPFDVMPKAERFGALPGSADMVPMLYRSTFAVEGEPCDTFLRLCGLTRGFAVLNGFNLGRHYRDSTQQTLYIPAPLLREGENELIVFDAGSSSPMDERYASFGDVHDLCRLTPEGGIEIPSAITG